MYFDVINGEKGNFHQWKVTVTSFETFRTVGVADDRRAFLAQRMAGRSVWVRLAD